MKPLLIPSFLFVAIAFIFWPASFGEQFFAKKKGKALPIIGANGSNPIVKEKGKLVTVRKAEIIAKEGKRSKPSEFSIEISRSKVVTHKEPRAKLQIDLSVRSSKPIEGAHLFVRTLYLSDGLARKAVIAALPKIEASEENEITLSIPTATYWERETIEILVFHEDRQIKLGNELVPHRTSVRPDSALPRVLFQVEGPKPPDGLLDDAPQAYVKVEFYIDRDGKVREARAIDHTHEELVDSAITSIKTSKYIPRYKDGDPVRSKLVQTIWFKRPKK